MQQVLPGAQRAPVRRLPAVPAYQRERRSRGELRDWREEDSPAHPDSSPADRAGWSPPRVERKVARAERLRQPPRQNAAPVFQAREPAQERLCSRLLEVV